VLLNLGWIDYVKGEHDESAVPFDLDRLQQFENAARHIDTPLGYWSAGRLALSVNDNERAARLLAQVGLDCDREPLFVRDYARTLHYAGKAETLTAYYHRCPDVLMTHDTKEMIAAAFLQQADQLLNTGDGASARSLWKDVLKLRPSDLYANFQLLNHTANADDQEADEYHNSLVQFTADAVTMNEPALVAHVAEVAPKLLQEGIWDRELMARVAAYLVMRHSKDESIRRMVEQLDELKPDLAEWPFLLGELYQRRGDLPQAITLYKESLARDPTSQRPALRITQVCAADSTMCEKLNVEDEIAQSIVNTATERLQLIGMQTGLPPESLSLDANLLANGSMEEWTRSAPSAWFVINHAGDNQYWNQGVFVASQDDLVVQDGDYSAAVTGLWNENDPRRSPSQTGYWLSQADSANPQWLELSPDSAYWVGLSYLTEGASDGSIAATLQLALSPAPLSMPIYLLTTNDRWRQAGVIICVPPAGEQEITFLVKSQTLGRVWFDNLGVWKIGGRIGEYCHQKETS
jgi:tetratricopeptide (TPR) repeat protein